MHRSRFVLGLVSSDDLLMHCSGVLTYLNKLDERMNEYLFYSGIVYARK